MQGCGEGGGLRGGLRCRGGGCEAVGGGHAREGRGGGEVWGWRGGGGVVGGGHGLWSLVFFFSFRFVSFRFVRSGISFFWDFVAMAGRFSVVCTGLWVCVYVCVQSQAIPWLRVWEGKARAGLLQFFLVFVYQEGLHVHFSLSLSRNEDTYSSRVMIDSRHSCLKKCGTLSCLMTFRLLGLQACVLGIPALFLRPVANSSVPSFNPVFSDSRDEMRKDVNGDRPTLAIGLPDERRMNLRKGEGSWNGNADERPFRLIISKVCISHSTSVCIYYSPRDRSIVQSTLNGPSYRL